MDKMLGPTGAMLVGAIFVCLCLASATSASDGTTADALRSIKEFHSDFISHKQDPNTGYLKLHSDTICFPWASRKVSDLEPYNSDIMPRSAPTKEKIIMKGSISSEMVQDLKAMNSIKQRDIIYEESQSKDPGSKSLVNSMDVRVTGDGQGKKMWSEDGFDSDGLEAFVDNAMISGMNKANDQKSGKDTRHQQAQNYMNIDVSGITINAINTVEGGSAVATSNIIIKPVQVIICPSEVEEKLK